MEEIWKVVVVIIYHHIGVSITLHNMLHGLRGGYGTGNVSLKAKLLQQLTAMREEFVYEIFMELHKAYVALYKDRCLEILEGFVVVPWARRLLYAYWDRLNIVACAGGYYRAHFKGYQGMTQGDPMSPNVFNVVL